MTDGEKMVWAAVFAKHYDLSSPPRDVVHDTKKWQAWESAQVHIAIECAAGAVERMREEVEAIAKGFGADSLVTIALADMVR